MQLISAGDGQPFDRPVCGWRFPAKLQSVLISWWWSHSKQVPSSLPRQQRLWGTKTPTQKWENGGLLTSGYRACEFASSFNYTISIELAVEVSTGENVKCKSYEKNNCSHYNSGRSPEHSLAWKCMSAGWEWGTSVKEQHQELSIKPKQI